MPATPFTTIAGGEITIAVPPRVSSVAAELEVVLTEGAREVGNAWSVWLFPDVTEPDNATVHGHPRWTWVHQWNLHPSAAPGVVVTETQDDALVAFMRDGGRVILAAGEGLVHPHPQLFGYVKYFFTPPANYAPYEDGQNGTIIADHPMLDGLPHAGVADWQCFRLIDNAPPLDLAPLGLADDDPIIRVIHRFPTLHPLGYLLERRVGDGGLIL